jgi:predicted phosphodiesterase
MFKFLHAADVHLDSPLVGLERYEGAPVEEIRGTTRRALENFVELAITEEVAFVLLAGDIFDGDWKDYNTGLFFVHQMARLGEAGIRAFVIAGNHDAGTVITKRLKAPKNVVRFSTRAPETKVLEDLDVAIHGQGFATRAVTEDLAAGYPSAKSGLFNIGLLHTSLDGRTGHEPYAPCTEDGLRSKGYDYWALGHVHVREEVATDPWIVFPGNLQGRHARETGPKGCTTVTVEDGEVRAVEHRDLDVFRWALCTADVTGAATPEAALDVAATALGEALQSAEERPLAVRLELTGACGAHDRLWSSPERWEAEFRALAVSVGSENIWVEKVLVRTTREADLSKAMERDDALGSLLTGIRNLEADASALATLAEGFTLLKTKLPAELLAEPEPTDPTDAGALRSALMEAKDLLLSRLLHQEEVE